MRSVNLTQNLKLTFKVIYSSFKLIYFIHFKFNLSKNERPIFFLIRLLIFGCLVWLTSSHIFSKKCWTFVRRLFLVEVWRLYHTLQNYYTRLLVGINKLVIEFTMHAQKKYYLMKNIFFLPDSTFFLEKWPKQHQKAPLLGKCSVNIWDLLIHFSGIRYICILHKWCISIHEVVFNYLKWQYSSTKTTLISFNKHISKQVNVSSIQCFKVGQYFIHFYMPTFQIKIFISEILH